jgi:NACalpha-BTF3-like transcription factor
MSKLIDSYSHFGLIIKTAELDGVRKVAKELKILNVDIEIIMKSTGLSKQEIHAL